MPTAPTARLGVSRLQYGQSDLADRCVVQLHRRILYVSGGERQESLYAGGHPFLPHDITVVSTAARPPMGIEGKEHITMSQKVYYDPIKDLSVLVYGGGFFMNTYDLIQDMTFSQANEWNAGAKVTYHMKDWFSVTGSLHGDFYNRYKRHERIDNP